MIQERAQPAGGLHPSGLRDRLARHGGFTVGVPDGDPLTSGMSVAVAPHLAVSFPFHQWCDRRVEQWLGRVLKVRPAALGGWIDERTGMVHLDVVQVVTNRRMAALLGRATQQHCMFDLDRRVLVGL